MWLGANPVVIAATIPNMITTVLVLSALLLSVVAFAKGVGAEYGLGGNRYGILVAMVGVISYLFGTSFQSGLLHVLSVSVFYCGSVLYLAGPRASVSTLPSALVVISSYLPSARGLGGLVILDELAWALIAISTFLLLDYRRAPRPTGCVRCASYRKKGEAFCASCGNLVGGLAGLSPRRFIGISVFSVLMLLVLASSVPMVTATPAVSLISYGLGGPSFGNSFAPLSGWSTKATSLSVNGSQVEEYTLTTGGETIRALATISPYTQNAAATLNGTRPKGVASVKLPTAIAQSMAGYTFLQKGVNYTDLQGVFQVSMLNGTSVVAASLGVDLRQATSAFEADQGSSLYAAASSVVSWTSTSSQWTSVLGEAGTAFQTFGQLLSASSFACVVVLLFAVARSDEMGKTRRLESLRGLGGPEVSVLNAFGTGTRPMTGNDLLQSSLRGGSSEAEGDFFSAMGELDRKGLISGSVEIKNWWPVLEWRRLV